MRRRRPSALLALFAAGALVAGPNLTATAAPSVPAKGEGSRPGTAAERILGTSRSAHPWYSGAWTGGHMSGARADRWGTWRGTPSDMATTYPERDTWSEIKGSTWHIGTFRSFRGGLMYGIPLLPSNGSATLADVAAGRHDAVFRKVATDLRRYGRGKAVVRIGWEANGDWYRWGVTADTADDYRRAFARVATVMRKASPGLVIDFDINCGTPLRGGSHRLDALTRLYPGDEYVDLIGCDVYDWHTTGATNDREWEAALRPADAPGLADVADFARRHRKGLSVPEWGLATPAAGGHGDNPYFIRRMRTFFESNRDVLVVESYFNEHADYIRNSLWSEHPQNPASAQVYRRLW